LGLLQYAEFFGFIKVKVANLWIPPAEEGTSRGMTGFLKRFWYLGRNDGDKNLVITWILETSTITSKVD
jgi:hypothetical protein